MPKRPKSQRYTATGALVEHAPGAQRWNGNGPIILAETGGPVEIGDPMTVMCSCRAPITIDPERRSVPLHRFEDELLRDAGLTRTEWGWRGHLGLKGLAHVVEHRSHTVAAITALGEFQPGRDVWAHHGVVEVDQVAASDRSAQLPRRAGPVIAVASVIAAFVLLNVIAIGGFLRSSELERSGARVTAEVVELRESGGPRQADRFVVDYRFVDRGGATHVGQASVDENRSFLASLSGKIEIAYDPENPARSAVVSNDQPALVLGMAIVVDLAVAGLVVAGLRKRQTGD